MSNAKRTVTNKLYFLLLLSVATMGCRRLPVLDPYDAAVPPQEDVAVLQHSDAETDRRIYVEADTAPDEGVNDEAGCLPDSGCADSNIDSGMKKEEITCADRCVTKGTVECVLSVGYFRICVEDDEGCLNWTDFKPCAEEFCDSQTSCGECDSECPELNLTSCKEGEIVRCAGDESGCLAWSTPQPCPLGMCEDANSCAGCAHHCDTIGAACRPDGLTLATCKADANGCRILVEETCANGCAEGACEDEEEEVPIVEKALVIVPVECAMVAGTGDTELRFIIQEVTGIDHVTISVNEVAGCGEQPVDESGGDFISTMDAEENNSHMLRSLSPGKWYKYTIESTAKEGYRSASTDGWIETGRMQEGWVTLAAGGFWMGSPDGNCPEGYPGGSGTDCISESGRYSREELHHVTLTHEFEIQPTEVTQGDFADVMGWNPSYHSASGEGTSCGLNCPVEFVSWYDALAYANQLSILGGLIPCYIFSDVVCEAGGSPTNSTDYLACHDTDSTKGGIESATIDLGGNASTPYECEGYRLPTEAEWEYAIRAESFSAFYPSDGNDGSSSDANLNQIGWYVGNSDTGAGSMTHPVAAKEPNAWGLYDMSGNVFEYVWDGFENFSPNSVTDPIGPATSPVRVIRGGDWNNALKYGRSAYRYDGFSLDNRNNDVGFRLARTIAP